MAVHERQTIREAVVAMLKGATEAGDSVYASRMAPWLMGELPAISVFTREENCPREYTNDQRRNMRLGVSLACAGAEAVDNDLDALALEVERLMAANPKAGGAWEIAYSEMSVEVVEEQRQPIAAATLTFDVLYFPGDRA